MKSRFLNRCRRAGSFKAIVGLALGVAFFASAFSADSQTNSSQHSKPLTKTSLDKAGMSDDRLNRIGEMIEKAIDEKQIPGAVALVARNGKVVYHKAFGMANSELGIDMNPDDIFRIASQSKAITSTAVMMLWEQGLFRLDDPISKWIPGFKDAGVLDTFNEQEGTWTTKPADKPITIRHLLTHTSGIGYGVIDGDPRFKKIYDKAGVTDLFTTEKITIGESVKELAKLPLHHNPGEKFTYSEGLDVLGYFIEIVSGKPFDVYLHDHLFEPLGMADTGFYLPEEKAGRLVSVQKLEDGKWVRYPVTFYDPDYPIKGARTFFSGGAGLCSTAKDYATFLQMYLNGGELNGVRILSRTTIETMMLNQTGELFGGGDKYYGLAFSVLTEKGQAKGGLGSPGTFDWAGYFNTQYFADPKQNIVGILMKQTRGGNDQSGRKFRLLVEAAVDE